MTQTMTSTGVTLQVTSCCVCGTEFAVPLAMLRARQESGGDLYCPSGHCLTWNETEVKELRRQLAGEQQKVNMEREYVRCERLRRMAEQERHEHTKRRLSATQGVVTKTKKRVGGGACPCCNRFFPKLRKHMKSKHPEYAADVSLPA